MRWVWYVSEIIEVACFDILSVQNLLFSCVVTKNVNIRIYKTIILLVVLYRCEAWSLPLWEEHREEGVEENIWTEKG
jgi:membrane protein YdbS with pleckstrin-like domain